METQRKNVFKNNKNGLYTLPGSYDADSSNAKVEVLLVKVLKGVENTNENLKAIWVDIQRWSLKVESYFSAIKPLEYEVWPNFCSSKQTLERYTTEKPYLKSKEL